MNPESIIGHPDAFLLLKITHDGVDAAVSDLREGDPDEELIIAVDDSHDKFSKIYVLAKEDVNNL